MNLAGLLPARYRETEDPLRTQRRVELVLVVLALVLLLQLLYGGAQLLLMASPEPIMPSEDSIQIPVVHNPQSVTAAQRNEILARPVFWAGRRPVDEVAVMEDASAAAGPASQLKDVKLVGMFGGGKSAGIIALVKGKKRRILQGEDLDGWTLDSVEAGQAVLVSGPRREVLTLQRGSIAAATAVSVENEEPAPVPRGAPKARAKAPAAAPAAANADKSAEPASGGLTLGGGVK